LSPSHTPYGSTKNRTTLAVSLNDTAIEILEGLRRRAESQCVFPYFEGKLAGAAIQDVTNGWKTASTRNRKRLETPAPFDATWELRFGTDNRFRVLYEIDDVKKAVNILAIGIKDRNRLLIGGEEFK
jgi:mRNA-degrading endonuclease RelE of RelBE toxin-antitoxin system